MLIWLKKVKHCKKGKILKNIQNFLKTYMIMQKTIIKFGNTEIQNLKSHQHKRPISFKIIDINKIVVCNKVSFVNKGFKHFIGYNGAKKTLCIFLPKMSAYIKDFDETNELYIFLNKRWWIIKKKTMKVGEKLKIVWKKILIVNQYTMKNIQKLKLKRY